MEAVWCLGLINTDICEFQHQKDWTKLQFIKMKETLRCIVIGLSFVKEESNNINKVTCVLHGIQLILVRIHVLQIEELMQMMLNSTCYCNKVNVQAASFKLWTHLFWAVVDNITLCMKYSENIKTLRTYNFNL